MLEKYKPGSFPFYEALRELQPAQLAQEWQEITAGAAKYLLDVLPPVRMAAGGFMVGECMTHSQHGAIYEAVICLGGRYFARPAYLGTFDPQRYAAEIREKFNL